ncbi:MAG: pyridoxamine 5'-phosphate oxidase family protein [Pseudomonadales bacterium]
MQVDAATLEALLARWPVGRLATVAADGRPHQVPVVFVADAERLYTPVDGKRKLMDGRPGTLARVVHVRARGYASLLLDAYDDDWSQLWWLRLDGPARVVTVGAAVAGDADSVAASFQWVATALREKYPQYRHVAPFSGAPTLIELHWQRVAAWSQAGDLTPMRRAAGLLPDA